MVCNRRKQFSSLYCLRSGGPEAAVVKITQRKLQNSPGSVYKYSFGQAYF